MSFRRRLQKELLELTTNPPPGITFNNDESQDFAKWIVQVEGPHETLYQGEKFNLCFQFNDKYPFDSPIVTFVGDNIPLHEHIYSNGHICLSILTTDWTPSLSVESVCLSIMSMLASAKEKKRPPDDAFHVRMGNKNPKKTRWWYHDDKV